MRALPVAVLALLAACSSTPATEAVMDLEADTAQAAAFFDFPYPSDLRLDAAGHPDLAGFPNPDAVELVEQLRRLAVDRPGFPVIPAGYFRFTGPIAAHRPEDVIAAAPESPVLLVDVDPASPDRGALVPTVAFTHPADGYVPANVLAVAARPGFVLHGGRRYAFVVRRDLGDATGERLGQPAALAALAAGKAPAGARGAAARDLYAPLFATLATLGVAARDVAAATVFTTGDVVADLGDISTGLRDAWPVSVRELAVEPDDGAAHERFCELRGTITYPQFQEGAPPFNTKGRFSFGADGLPTKQRDEDAPVVITLPKGEMPAGGYPLVVYTHGSGGLAAQAVDRGPVLVAGGEQQKGLGPAHVLAAHGFATAASAMPVNPERLPGAGETAYLNMNNLEAFRDTFRQGAIEQRLFMEALRTIAIPESATQGCTGLTLPAGETAFRFNAAEFYSQGQSMGGMYANMISAIEPRIRAVVPTGAGGFWGYFILETSLIEGAKDLLVLILGTDPDLTFLHPTLHLLETAWEPAEPLVFMPRIARRPLAGHPVRPIYEPVGRNDEYFPTAVYDAVALAYGHEQAGDVIWPSMQTALAPAGLDGLQPYPVRDNLTSADGSAYTGVVIQYEGDGLYDPHGIAFQLDTVKYQYGCFLETMRDTGTATVLAPQPLGSPCE